MRAWRIARRRSATNATPPITPAIGTSASNRYCHWNRCPTYVSIAPFAGASCASVFSASTVPTSIGTSSVSTSVSAGSAPRASCTTARNGGIRCLPLIGAASSYVT